MSRWATQKGLGGGLCAVALLALAPAVAQAAPRVRVGRAPVLPARASATGPVPGSERLHVTVVLSPRDPAGLTAYATAVSTPGSPVYHRYLSVAQFAQRYGPSSGQIAAVRSALRAQGLAPGDVSANGLSIGVSATADRLEQAFSTQLERVALPSGRTALTNTEAPALGAGAAPYVQTVVGLNTLAVPHPEALTRARSAAVEPMAAPLVATGGPQPCATAVSAAAANPITYTADQVASAYSFSSLYANSDKGAGQTVALYELEGNFPGDVTAFQSCYGTSASVTYKTVDGGPPSPSQSQGDGVETELDIENVVGLAPKASIVVYQAPNSDSGSAGSGPYDAYAAIVSDDTAKVISTSWGLCEAYEGSTDADAEHTLFEEAAVQGQTVVAASGDAGSADCYGSTGTGPTTLAVDDPGSQPFVTSVGGTQLSSLGPPPTEAVWNGGCSRGACGGGGGGGISTLWAMPSYQSQALSTLNVINAKSSNAPCGAPAGGYCREVPDVSADADPSTGYLVYYGGNGSATDSSAWQTIGGTSGAAPLWAALVALANASSACSAGPVGFLNPALYGVASGAVTGVTYASAFHDVTAGDNDIFGTNAGQYHAGTGFDMASGLGTPDAAALPGALCQASSGGTTTVTVPTTTTTTPTTTTRTTPTTPTPTPRPKLTVGNPGAQTTIVGAPVHLQIAVNSSDRGSLTYYSAGLPAGLFINPSTGIIYGTPTQPGRSAVAVAAADSVGAAGGTAFQWTVAGLPTAARTAVSGLASRRAKISFILSAGAYEPALASLQVGLPAGLSFGSLARGLAVNGPGRARLTFSAHVSHGVLTLILAAPSSGAQVTISSPALRVSTGLARRARRHRAGTMRVALTATDAGQQTTALIIKLKP